MTWGLGVSLDFLTQARDEVINGSLGHGLIDSPNVSQNLQPREDSVLMHDEVLQKLEFSRSRFDDTIVNCEPARSQVNDGRSESQHALCI